MIVILIINLFIIVCPATSKYQWETLKMKIPFKVEDIEEFNFSDIPENSGLIFDDISCGILRKFGEQLLHVITKMVHHRDLIC